MRAVVTGGAGFIGSHLVDRLMNDGYSVAVLDDLSAGRPENLARHHGDERFELVRGSVTDAKVVFQTLVGSDVVFHLAAFADLRKSFSHRKLDFQVNLGGMLNVLDAMADLGIRDLVYSSTSSLYGEARLLPTPEDYAPVQTSLYGASKLSAECFAEAYTSLTSLRLHTFRFSNVVGERCRRGVVWDFVHKLQADNTKLEILGDGNQQKEFMHVSDCIEGLMTGYRTSSDLVSKFNLAVENLITPGQIADIVINEMGLKGVRKVYTGGKGGWIGDNPVVELDTSKIKSLGWRPHVSSEDAIRRMVTWILGDGAHPAGVTTRSDVPSRA